MRRFLISIYLYRTELSSVALILLSLLVIGEWVSPLINNAVGKDFLDPILKKKRVQIGFHNYNY